MRILSRTEDADLREELERVATRLRAHLSSGAEIDDAGRVDGPGQDGAAGRDGAADPDHAAPGSQGPDVLVVDMPEDGDLTDASAEADRLGAALLVACRDMEACAVGRLAGAHDWILLPADPDEIETRLTTARQRARRSAMEDGGGLGDAPSRRDVADFLRYEELLFDRLTGFPTLPVMLERARDLADRRGEVTILYIQFVWYEKDRGDLRLAEARRRAGIHGRGREGVLPAAAPGLGAADDGQPHRRRRLHPVHGPAADAGHGSAGACAQGAD